MKKSPLNDDTAQYLNEIDYTSTWSVAHHMRFLMIANYIVKHNIKTVLDVGFGQNVLVRYLKNAGFTGSYTGVDMNQEYVKAAIEECAGLPFSTYYLEGDIDVVAEDKFDCIVLGEVIEHIPKEKASAFMAVCKEMLNTPDGVILLSTPNKIDGVINWPDDHVDEFSYDELIKLYQETGFTVLASYGLWNNTKNTLAMLSDGMFFIHGEYSNIVPASLLNVFFNLVHPRESRAVLFVLGHTMVTPF